MKGDRTKKRPRRLFYDENKDKYFYLVNKKKKYVKIPAGISQKQVARINIKNIIGVPVKKRIVRQRRDIKPILTKQVVSKLVPIAPVAQNLTSLYTPKDSEKLLERLTKLEEKSKPVDVKPPVKEEIKPTKKLIPDVESRTKEILDRARKIRAKSPGYQTFSSKTPKPTNANVLVEALRLQEERDAEFERLNTQKYIDDNIEAIDDGFEKTNPDLELFGRDEGSIEEPKKSALTSIKKTQWAYNSDFLSNLRSIVPNYKLLETDEEIDQGYLNFISTINRPDKTNITKEKFRKFLKQLQDSKELETLPKRPSNISFIGSEGNIATFGRGSYSNDNDGIFNDELQEIFEDKTNRFLPVIPSDKMDTLLPMVNRDTEKFGWIQNTEPSGSEGRHWVAYFIDIPNLEVNYYDSLVENDGIPPRSSLKGLKKIIDKIHPEYYLLFKHNQIRDQNPNSANCGYFSLKFLMDRFRGVSFKKSTGYSDIYGNGVVDNFVEGENKIKRFKNFL
jgi:hypothetical protein